MTATTCLGPPAGVQEKVGAFFGGQAERTEEVKRRCRTTPQVEAAALLACVTEMLREIMHVDPVCASV